MDFKCWISNTNEFEEKPRLRRWFEGALLCKLNLHPFRRLSDQRLREPLAPMNLFRVAAPWLSCDEQ